MHISKAKLAAVLVSAAMILSGCGAAEIPATENTAPVQTTAEEAVPAAVESVSTTSVTKVPELDLDALATPTEPEEQLSPAELKLRDMTLEEKVGQLFVIRPEQLAGSISEEGIGNSGDECLTLVSDDMAEFAAQYHIGGYALFARNIETPKQLKRFTADLKAISDLPPMLLIDEEGGDITRIAGSEKFPDVPVFGNMHDIGETGDAEKAREAGAAIGGYLAEYGFTGDLAPVADINSNPDNIVIGDRAFGDDPETVSAMVSAFIDGL
ncbi:MAG: glycoside hydrolase family 3 protein, partial [Ruminococcus sp.]|nr:glycoside hydrolase family 3 protein [Ruminococcus sp.]